MSNKVSNTASAHRSLFWEDPAAYFGDSYTKAHSVPRADLEAIQLLGLQERFSQLHGTIPYLQKLAEAQGASSMDELDDVVPLLFQHPVYKTYPPEVLAKGEFTKLNYWLNKLTAHDLGAIDVSGCALIDDWIEVMAEQSEVVPWVSSGTSGVMTFMPHSKEEMDRFARTYKMNLLQDFGDDPAQAMAGETHEIWPFYRYPGGGMNIDFDLRVKHMLGGDESRFHSLYPGKNSLDVRYLQAQTRLAEMRGELDKLEAPPHLLQRKEELEQAEREMPAQLDGFLARCADVVSPVPFHSTLPRSTPSERAWPVPVIC